MEMFPPRGANDVSQYGGIANRRVALAGAMGHVNNNLNAAMKWSVEQFCRRARSSCSLCAQMILASNYTHR